MKKSPVHLSDSRPNFAPFEINCGTIPAYRYKGNLRSELDAKTITRAEAVAILEDILVVRELEEMIVKLRSGAYANGVVLESLNFAAQAQFNNHYAAAREFGLPIVFLICNNHYGMTHRSDDEVMGINQMARRDTHRSPSRVRSQLNRRTRPDQGRKCNGTAQRTQYVWSVCMAGQRQP